MGTPMKPRGSSALDYLVGSHEISTEDWLEMVEIRARTLKSFLSHVTLGELGDVQCLRNGRQVFSIRKNSDASGLSARSDFAPIGAHKEPLSVASAFEHSLGLRGVYIVGKRTPLPGTGVPAKGPGDISWPDGHLYIWGLARDGSWILAKVIWRGIRKANDEAKERPVVVQVGKSNPVSISEKADVGLREMWLELGRIATHLLEERKRFVSRFEDSVLSMQTENRVLSAHEKNTKLSLSPEEGQKA